MNIFFRVDSSTHIGLGHVMRCLVLAEQLLLRGHSIHFICRDLPGNYIPALKDLGYVVLILPNESSSSYEKRETYVDIDLQQTMSLVKNQKIDWLIVDHYKLDWLWESHFRTSTKKIMVIDDLANRKHDCDLLLDQNYYTTLFGRYDTLLPSFCKLLIGPSYALLRNEFSEQRKSLAVRNGEINRLLVSLGGSDFSNTTLKILEGIQDSNFNTLPTDVVLTENSPYKDDIKEWCYARKNYQFYCPSKNMAALIKNADLSIGAGGTTTWERCCLGLPTLVVRVASNQDELIKQGLLANIFDFLGDVLTIKKENITHKLNTLASESQKLRDMSQNGMNLVDGLGATRVVNHLLTLT